MAFFNYSCHQPSSYKWGETTPINCKKMVFLGLFHPTYRGPISLDIYIYIYIASRGPPCVTNTNHNDDENSTKGTKTFCQLPRSICLLLGRCASTAALRESKVTKCLKGQRREFRGSQTKQRVCVCVFFFVGEGKG